jgi:nucleoside-diphosphate-sugar epimerase
MKRVLLTGATGFIGRQCVPLLRERGLEVHAVSSRRGAEGAGDVRWHEADLLDAARVAELIGSIRPTHLLHMAWYAAPGKYWTAGENLSWTQASLGLLQAFARAGGERVVVAGTCAEYDWRYGFCSEGLTPLRPATLYGTCKHSLQLMLEALALESKMSAAWGRIFFLYGPHEHPSRLVAHVIRGLLRGERVPCTHGRQVRDFLHVRDVASAFVSLLESDVRGAVNIASGLPVSVRDIVGMIAEQLGGEELIDLGAIEPKEEPPLLVANVARLKDEVGWEPDYDLRRGLAETIDWWRNRPENL